jgi:hypothetical protein
MKLTSKFDSESIQLLKNTIESKEAANVFDKITKEAYIDILDCINKESIKTADELEDYIETMYAELNETVYFAVCELLAYADGEYDISNSNVTNMKEFIQSILTEDD